ncbi:hypothetical protein HYV50_03535 [Candidatus Pacearchaeota archaeon]|nr:hypothetical protein [Candidatus Pacearchaeota archaeon]
MEQEQNNEYSSINGWLLFSVIIFIIIAIPKSFVLVGFLTFGPLLLTELVPAVFGIAQIPGLILDMIMISKIIKKRASAKKFTLIAVWFAFIILFGSWNIGWGVS